MTRPLIDARTQPVCITGLAPTGAQDVVVTGPAAELVAVPAASRVMVVMVPAPKPLPYPLPRRHAARPRRWRRTLVTLGVSAGVLGALALTGAILAGIPAVVNALGTVAVTLLAAGLVLAVLGALLTGGGRARAGDGAHCTIFHRPGCTR